MTKFSNRRPLNALESDNAKLRHQLAFWQWYGIIISTILAILTITTILLPAYF